MIFFCFIIFTAVTVSHGHLTSSSKHWDSIIDGSLFKRTSTIKDLKDIFDVKLNFNTHIEAIVAEAYLRLTLHEEDVSRDFSDPFCLKSEYCSSLFYFRGFVSCMEYAVFYIIVFVGGRGTFEIIIF